MKPFALRLSISTVYLLPCRGGYLQIDTAYPHDYPLYRERLRRAGIDTREVAYLLLTHHHDDHAGFLNDLTQDSPARVVLHREAAGLLKAGTNDRSRGGGYVNRFIRLVAGLKMRLDPRWTLSFPPYLVRPEDILLAGDDDQLLREIGIPGRILYTPGHCIDHLSVVLDTGEAFCGDAAASFLLWAGTKYCTVFMTDMTAAYQSWQRLLEAGANVIYPAHGSPFPAVKLGQNMGRIPNEKLASL
jgi:glyoxylase-like metal-dependent hydrolase (beta-lactamase superfamily II)